MKSDQYPTGIIEEELKNELINDIETASLNEYFIKRKLIVGNSD